MTVHTEQRWSADSADDRIRSAWQIAYEAVGRVTGFQHAAIRAAAVDAAFDALADGGYLSLPTLALAGRLLPDGGETHEEHGFWNPVTREVQSWWSYSEQGYNAPDRRRTVTTWPDGREYRTPWEPIRG